jgi:ectoine hydroxylase-related dioxygenase (phytanoyl-CoA dioxygenase family)
MEFPILTPAERLHLEVYGYVLVRGLVPSSEVVRLREEVFQLKAEAESPSPGKHSRVRIGGSSRPPYSFHLRECMQQVRGIAEHAISPSQILLAEEAVGQEARLVEAYAIVNRSDPATEASNRLSFHRGQDPCCDGYVANGLFHCHFVKTLTYLTDVGPEDGGTAVIAGSHKLTLPFSEMEAAAYESPSLIHQVVAKAGDVLLQFESVIHSTGINRSDQWRVLLVCGYAASHYPWWDGTPITRPFLASLSAAQRRVVEGRPSWERPSRRRILSTPSRR